MITKAFDSSTYKSVGKNVKFIWLFSMVVFKINAKISWQSSQIHVVRYYYHKYEYFIEMSLNVIYGCLCSAVYNEVRWSFTKKYWAI